jgi:hypothetical protein
VKWVAAASSNKRANLPEKITPIDPETTLFSRRRSSKAVVTGLIA